MLKVFNVIGVIVLLLLLRKLIWCLRWLWCWKHDRETPPPIGWLPSRDGGLGRGALAGAGGLELRRV